jgi:hypothetical protein
LLFPLPPLLDFALGLEDLILAPELADLPLLDELDDDEKPELVLDALKLPLEILALEATNPLEEIASSGQ